MFWLLSIDDGRPRKVDIPEKYFAEFAGMNPHVIHFMTEDETRIVKHNACSENCPHRYSDKDCICTAGLY